MSRNRVVVSFLLVLTAGFTALGVWFATREEAAQEAELAPPTPIAEEPIARSTPSSGARVDARTEDIVADSADAITSTNRPPPIAPPSESWSVSGRVLDVAGEPVAGLDVFEDSHPSNVFAKTSGDGAFAFAFGGEHVEVAAAGESWSTIRTGSVSKGGPHDGAIVLVVPTVPLSGRVTDESGVGVDDARVRCEVADAALARFPHPLDRTAGVYPTVYPTRGGGAFTFPKFPRLAQTRITAEANGFEPRTVIVDATSNGVTKDVVIVLKRTDSSERVVRGVVVHADGSAAPEARVRLDDRSVEVDAAGGFVIPVPTWLRDETPLVAYAAGARAAVLPAFGETVRKSSFPLAPVRLVLGPAPLTIEGRVVAADGRALAGWTVGLVKGTSVSQGRTPAITAEDLTAGGSVDETTSEDGKFRLAGLFDREYEVFAYDSRTLVRVETAPIRAGTRDVEIRVPADAVAPKVVGRVVAKDGTPIAGVSVAVGLVTGRDEGAMSWINGASTLTDRDGSFELADVPRNFAHLDVSGDKVIPLTQSLEGADLNRPLRIEVARRCHFRIEGLPTSTDVHWLVARDAEGQELSLWEFQSNGWSSTNRVQLTTDTTRVYAVSETAVEILLHHPYDKVVGRRPLTLVPDDVSVVRW